MLYFKKTALVASICTTSFFPMTVSALTYDVVGGSFLLPSISPGNIASETGGIDSWSEGEFAFDGSAFGKSIFCTGCGAVDPSVGF